MNATYKKFFAALPVALLLLSHNICHGAITESLSFPADDMTLTTDTIDGVVYCNVAYSDTYNNGETAQPSLPVRYYTFSIPYNAANLSVSADVLDVNIIPSPATVFPIQVPQLADGSVTPAFTMPDSGVYNTNAFFPSQIASITGEGYYQGDNHIVTVALCPIQYNPVAGQLRVNNEIELNISYSLVDESALPMRVVSRNSSSLRTEGINSTKSIVFNPSSVEGFAAPVPITPYTTEPLPMYQYCVITSRELAPAFERLVGFKQNKGYDAGIVCMEDIIACEEYQNGDVTSGINDDAGKLRAFLTDAFKNGTKYVLLGGKEPHVPIRYGSSAPSDLYFRELNSNWNGNNNSTYGEEFDNIDYHSDLAVGRLLCKNQTEVNNYIDKLIKHDLDPGNGDYSYLNRSFYTYSYSMMMYNDTSKIESVIYDVYPDYTRICQDGSFPTGSYVVSQINQTTPYFMGLHGHGNPCGILLTDIKYEYPELSNTLKHSVTALDNENIYFEEEDGNGLDCITNNNYPGIMYSMSCSTMPYDIFSESDITYDVSQNFGESYTLGKNYGGVAYLGYTRSGHMGTSTTIEQWFLEELKKGNTIISDAEEFSITKSWSHHLKIGHNLLGDPSIDIWTGIPVKYTDADIDVYRDGTTICVSGSCLDGAKIVVIDTNGNILTGTGKSNGGTYFTASPSSNVVVYRHNMIPYLAPLLIQNETINNPLYYFANTVGIGSIVDSNRQQGNVVFGSNADCVIEAMGDVYLGPGLTLNAGASLTIKTKGKITINGCAVKSGAAIRLEGSALDIVNNINAEVNSVFDYNLIKN